MTRTGGPRAGRENGCDAMAENMTRRNVFAGALAAAPAVAATPDSRRLTVKELESAMIYWLYQRQDHAPFMVEKFEKHMLRQMRVTRQ